MPFSNFFDNIKSGGFNLMAEQYLKKLISPYGSLNSFKIDRNSKHISLSVMLNGESAPLDAEINDYKLVEQNHKTYFVPGRISFSRKWLNDVYRDVFPKLFKDSMIEIPSEYSSYAKQFL